MVLKAENPVAQAQANTAEVLPADEVPCDLSDQSSSSTSPIIYTPPDSGTETENMASTAGNKGASPSPQAPKIPDDGGGSFTITTTHGPKPVLQDPSATNISKREYIYFLPYPLPPNTETPYSIHLPHKNPLNLPSHQFEPTSTLVLTSPNHTFVDVRIYKSFSKDAISSNSAGPAPIKESTNVGNSAHLDWAFTGTSTSVPITPPPTGPQHGKSAKKLKEETWVNVTHSTWTHWLDSRFPVGHKNIPVDEGDMYPIAPGLTLEHGHGYHPALGAVKTHEEMWRDIDAVSTNEKGSMVCVVMRCQADHAGVRGVVVRLGQYCQGILMWGDKVTVERWEWENGEGKTGKEKVGVNGGKSEIEKWNRTVRVGDGFLPCGVTFRPEILSVGAVVKFQDFEWKVEECWEWK